MKTWIADKLLSTKLSSAAYIDYGIAGLLTAILAVYGKYVEAGVMLSIAIVYNLIARKLSRNGR
jgi:branched-subunit amino acid transport protein